MTFNQAEVINTASFSGSVSINSQTTDTQTLYTVPAGRYAIAFFNRAYARASSSLGAVKGGAGNIIRATNEEKEAFGIQALLESGQTITITASSTGGTDDAAATANGSVIEFNNP